MPGCCRSTRILVCVVIQMNAALSTDISTKPDRAHANMTTNVRTNHNRVVRHINQSARGLCKVHRYFHRRTFLLPSGGSECSRFFSYDYIFDIIILLQIWNSFSCSLESDFCLLKKNQQNPPTHFMLEAR